MFGPNDDDFANKTTTSFYMWGTTTPLSPAEIQQLRMAQNALTMFGGRVADSVEVTKFVGPEVRQVEQYTASKPANG